MEESTVAFFLLLLVAGKLFKSLFIPSYSNFSYFDFGTKSWTKAYPCATFPVSDWNEFVIIKSLEFSQTKTNIRVGWEIIIKKGLCMCVIEMERLWATRWLVTGKITEAMVLNQSPIYAHVLLKMYTTWKVTVFKKKWNKSSAACWRTLDDEAFLKSRRGTSKTLNYIAPTHTILRHRQWSQMVEEKEITQYTQNM